MNKYLKNLWKVPEEMIKEDPGLMLLVSWGIIFLLILIIIKRG